MCPHPCYYQHGIDVTRCGGRLGFFNPLPLLKQLIAALALTWQCCGKPIRWPERSGRNLMYFETRQGSALSANARYGVDAHTCEVRAYALARKFSLLLVNTVVGFIGPEYLYEGKQIILAGLYFCHGHIWGRRCDVGLLKLSPISAASVGP